MNSYYVREGDDTSWEVVRIADKKIVTVDKNFNTAFAIAFGLNNVGYHISDEVDARIDQVTNERFISGKY